MEDRICQLTTQNSDLSNLVLRREREIADLVSLKVSFRNAASGILEYAHKVAEMADLEDNHPFWAWIADLNDVNLESQKRLVSI